MSQFYTFLTSTLRDGNISDDEVPLIRQQLHADGKLNSDDVRLLVELYCEAENRSPAFDELFFATLEKVFLADGQLSSSEEYFLLKMLYSDREIRTPELDFLRRLQKQLPHRPASFESLIATALESPRENWSVGGRMA